MFAIKVLLIYIVTLSSYILVVWKIFTDPLEPPETAKQVQKLDLYDNWVFHICMS
jgi:hypothetical protein